MSAPLPPEPDLESGPFWAGLEARRIVLQDCAACGRRRFPRMPSCPYCAAEGGVDVEVPGTGRVYSWVRVDRAMTAAMVDQVPYCIATVDLDGGGRIHARLDPPGDVSIGMAVAPVFVRRDGWTELRFVASGGEL